MDVVKTKQRYDAAVSKLGDLMDKSDTLKRKEAMKARVIWTSTPPCKELAALATLNCFFV